VIQLAKPGGTLQDAVTNYTTEIHPYTTAVTGNPAIFVMQWDQDEANCNSATTIEANYTTLWNDIWADGSQLVVTTPIPYGYNNTCWGDITSSLVRDWMKSQAQFLNAHGSYVVDAAAQMNSPFDSYYLQQAVNSHHPTDALATIYASLVENALRTGTNYLPTEPPVGISQQVVGGTDYRYPHGFGKIWADPSTQNSVQMSLLTPASSDLLGDYLLIGIWAGGENFQGGLSLQQETTHPQIQAVLPGLGYGGFCWVPFSVPSNTNPGVTGGPCLSEDAHTSGQVDVDLSSPGDQAASMAFANLHLSGTPIFAGIAPTGSTSCLQISTAGVVSNTGAACGGGGGSWQPVTLSSSTDPPTATCNSTTNNGTFATSTSLSLYQCSNNNSSSTYAWNVLASSTVAFTLTTTGSSGSATYSGGVLNIPQYSGGGGIAPETHTASNSAELDFTSCFSSSYLHYQITYSGLTNSTGNYALVLQFYGSSAYDATDADYASGRTYAQLFGGSGGGANNGLQSIPGTAFEGQSASWGMDTRPTVCNGGFQLDLPNSANDYVMYTGKGNCRTGGNSGVNSWGITFWGGWNGAQTTTKFRIVAEDNPTASGLGDLIASGTVTCQPLAQ
jgi:hypothetical protein